MKKHLFVKCFEDVKKCDTCHGATLYNSKTGSFECIKCNDKKDN